MQSAAVIMICMNVCAGVVRGDAFTAQSTIVGRSPISFADYASSAAPNNVTQHSSGVDNTFHIGADDDALNDRSQHGNKSNGNNNSNGTAERALHKTSQANNQLNATTRYNETVMIETKDGNASHSGNRDERRRFGGNDSIAENSNANSGRNRRFIGNEISQNVCESMCNCRNDTNFLTIECHFDQVSRQVDLKIVNCSDRENCLGFVKNAV